MIKGKTIAQKILKQSKQVISAYSFTPTLVTFYDKTNPAACLYTHIKSRVCYSVGVRVINKDISFVDNSIKSKARFFSMLHHCNQDKHINGILIERPLPKAIRSLQINIDNKIAVDKDVDGVTLSNIGSLAQGRAHLISCTARAVMELLFYNLKAYSFAGLKVAIINRSDILGKPLAMMLVNNGAVVTVYNHYMKPSDLANNHYDVIVAATGKAHVFTADNVKGASILVPISEVKTKYGLQGDFTKKALQSVPIGFTCTGNVGPLTNAFLVDNVLNVDFYQSIN